MRGSIPFSSSSATAALKKSWAVDHPPCSQLICSENLNDWFPSCGLTTGRGFFHTVVFSFASSSSSLSYSSSS